MKREHLFGTGVATMCAILLVVGLAAAQAPQAALGTAFTYQGQLRMDGSPVNDTCDFQFSLWDAAGGGTQIGATQTRTNVAVSNGYFTIPDLDFGSAAFQGDARWLAIAVRCPAGSGSYTTLSPRQALTAAPYALALPGLWTQQNSTSPNLIGGHSGNSVTSGVYGATIGGGGAAGSINRVTDNYGTVGGGLNNRAGDNAGTTSDQPYATVGGGVGNTASGYAAIVGGGYENTANGSYTTVGGGRSNSASSGATIGGGWYNTASGTNAIVSGGLGNTASGTNATVGGGYDNTASAPYSTIAGGGPSNPSDPTNTNNRATGDYGVIGGGGGNTASGPASTVSGGWSNLASGESASVGGGDYNVAAAAYATIAGGGPAIPQNPTSSNNRVSDDYGVIGGGGSNRAGNGDGDTTNARYASVGGGVFNTASGESTTIGGGDTNTASGHAATVSGGMNNSASSESATVGGGRSNTASGSYATIGGGRSNTAGDWDATIGGGWNNTARGDSATVGGGGNQTATGGYATIGGGWNNNAGGGTATIGGGGDNVASGDWATVGGGRANVADAPFATIAGGGPSNPSDPENTNNRVTDEYGTVGGGGWNRAGNGDSDTTNAPFATIGGGRGNTASGYAATVPGGLYNTAQGAFSFAAGRRAKAYNQGCFVLADATDADEPCVNDNRFVFRVTNGFYIWTTANHTAGVLLPTGGNAWSPISDRAAKENYETVDTRDVLDRLAAIPIQTWNYKSQDPAIRHIGPVAQDFSAAFEVGEDDTHISTVDADGVALAAIQGLYGLVQEQEARIAAQQAQIDALLRQNAELDARLSALESGAGGAPLPVPWLVVVGLVLGAGGAWAARRRPEGGR